MASYSEIEKLEQRHRESPEGRTFAPLADAYRRAGRLAEAVELVQAGLLKHPEYVSAHIVLGRCLLDQDDTAAARTAFERVFQLDSENIIALRTLSELAEREHRLSDAARWLTLAKDVDPMNADVRDALERVDAQLAEAGAPEPLTPLPEYVAPAPAAVLPPEVPSSEPVADEAQAVAQPPEASPEQEPVTDQELSVLFDETPSAGGEAGEEPIAFPGAAASTESEREVASEDIEAPPAEAPPVEEEPAEIEGSLADESFVVERAADPQAEAEAPPVFDLEVIRVEGEEQPEGEPEEPDEDSIGDFEIERASMESAPQGGEPWMPVGMDTGPIVPFESGVDFSAVADEAEELDVEFEEPEPMPEQLDVPRLEGLADTQFESAFQVPEETAEPPEAEAEAEAEDTAEDAVAAAEAVVETAEDVEEPPTPRDQEMPGLAPEEAPEPEPAAEVEEPPPVAFAAEAAEAAASLDDLFSDEVIDEVREQLDQVSDDEEVELEEEAAEGARARADSALADLPVFIPEEESSPPPPTPVASPVDDDYSAADHETLGDAEPVVTETMAELLVSQGHVDEAIGVYRKLLEARPGDAGLEGRLAALEKRPVAGTGPTVGEWFQQLATAQLVTPPASVQTGTSAATDSALSPGVEAPRGPLSLEEVFGETEREEASPGDTPASASATQPESTAPSAAEEPDGFSFEAFFGGEAEAPEAEPNEDAEADLDEFQAWLRGLKS